MRLYVQLSGAFFGLLAAVQLTRFLMSWPVTVAAITIPVWASGLAFVVAGSFALWAFRASRAAAGR